MLTFERQFYLAQIVDIVDLAKNYHGKRIILYSKVSASKVDLFHGDYTHTYIL